MLYEEKDCMNTVTATHPCVTHGAASPGSAEEECLFAFKRSPSTEGKLWANDSTVKSPSRLSDER